MSLYDALEALGTGRVAVSVDIPGWVVVNLDTGNVERVYVENDDLNTVAPHDYITGTYVPRENVYHVAMEVDNTDRPDGSVYPTFTDEVGSDKIVERACKLIDEQGVPKLEVLG
jgi:hypothetical protein